MENPFSLATFKLEACVQPDGTLGFEGELDGRPFDGFVRADGSGATNYHKAAGEAGWDGPATDVVARALLAFRR